jgi:hypothetical protein
MTFTKSIYACMHVIVSSKGVCKKTNSLNLLRKNFNVPQLLTG